MQADDGDDLLAHPITPSANVTTNDLSEGTPRLKNSRLRKRTAATPDNLPPPSNLGDEWSVRDPMIFNASSHGQVDGNENGDSDSSDDEVIVTLLKHARADTEESDEAEEQGDNQSDIEWRNGNLLEEERPSISIPPLSGEIEEPN